MPFIILFILILIPRAAAAVYFKQPLIKSAAGFLLSVLAVGYIFSLFGAIKLCVPLYQAVVAFGAGFLIYDFYKTKKLPQSDFLWEFVLLFAVFAGLWWICRGHCFARWDEMSHWGRAVKALYNQNTLISVTDLSDNFKEYPPCCAPLQYILGKAGAFHFREDVIIYIQSIFSAVLLCGALPVSKKKISWDTFLCSALMAAAPLTVFPAFYTEIMPDGMLGVLTAYIILTSFFSEGEKRDKVYISLGYFVLGACMKSTGIMFAVFALAVTLITAQKKKRLSALIPFAFAAAGKLSWTLFININNVPRRWSSRSFTLENLYLLIFRGQPRYRVHTVNYYLKNIFADFNYGSIVHFPVVVFALICAVCIGVIAFSFKDKEDRKKRLYLCGGLSVCFVLYLAAVLVSYLFFFSETEAVILASLSRYINPILVVMCAAVFALTYHITSNTAVNIAKIAACGCLWVAVTSPSAKNVAENLIKANIHAATTANSAAYYSSACQKILDITDNFSKNIYVIYQQDFGLTPIKFDYYMQPYTFPECATSIGTPYDDGDIWTAYYTDRQWSQLLREKYEYVYLMDVDDKFINEFSSVFENPADISDGTMFKVNKDADGTALLQKTEG